MSLYMAYNGSLCLLELELLILTDTMQPAVSSVGPSLKLMFSAWRPSREVWLALIDRGVADTSWTRKQRLTTQNVFISLTLILDLISYPSKT